MVKGYQHSLRNFNSQPHEEADESHLFVEVYENISTHSLTKRLTVTEESVLKGYFISTHSLTKRLTTHDRDVEFMVDISTHSLTKRLTARNTSRF